jgi:spore germination protein KC
VLLLISTFIIVGCGRYYETDSIAYILAMGIDKHEKGMMVTYQIGIPRAVAGTEAGGGVQEKFITTTITSVNLAENRNLLGATMSRIPLASHVKAVIIGEEYAKQGIGPLISPLMRFREYRGSILVIVVRGTAKDFIEKNNPRLEIAPSKYYDGVMFNSDESGSLRLLTDLHDFYLRLKEQVGSPYAVYAGINPKDNQSRPSDPRVPPEKFDEYIPGNMPRSGTENPEFIGTAIFRYDKMVGRLTSEETRMVAILQGKFDRGFIVVEDPLQSKDAVNVYLSLDERPIIKASREGGRFVFDIAFRLEGVITSIPSGINYEKEGYRELLENQVSQLITMEIVKMLRYTQQVQSDPVGFTTYMRPFFRTYEELTEANVNQMYSEAEFRINVQTAIRRTGLMWRTSPVIQ